MIERICHFSTDRAYRYTLFRDASMFDKRLVQFICLNPSTADETHNDPTVTRCVDFVDRWGYGTFCMTNLFAFRATDPDVMKRAVDPVGPENMKWLRAVCLEADLIIAAWGEDGIFNGQSHAFLKSVMDVDLKIYCLAHNRSGQPKHPLYIAGNATPKPFNF